jgi:glycosyltransferase involved in cell wall biosynthesis
MTQSPYPGGYHVVNFLGNALIELGADVQYDDERRLGQEGLTVNGIPIVWFLDNRVPYNRERQDPVCAELLRRGECIVLHCQKQDMLRCGGGWMPIAATPRFHPASDPVEPEWDIAFVGYLNDEHRKAVMMRVAQKFSFLHGVGVFYEEAAAVYHQARVGLNVPALYGTPFDYDINMRTLEIPASGIPLVTAYNPALSEMGFRSGVNCLTYDNEHELHQCIHTLLSDPELAMEIAVSGHTLVQNKHTYYHRAMHVLEMVRQWSTSQPSPS